MPRFQGVGASPEKGGYINPGAGNSVLSVALSLGHGTGLQEKIL